MKIKCPACSKVLAIPESAAGKVVKCPCGKQLRAPGGTPAAAAPAPQTPAQPSPTAAKPAARPAAAKPTARPAAARPTAARPPAARPAAARPAAAQPAGFDGLFDELTDDDLKPVPGGGIVEAYAPPTGNTAKLLQEHAATAGGSNLRFRVGDLASPWNRLAAAIIDGFVIGFIAGPVLAILMAVLGGSMADFDAVRNATTEAEAQAATQRVVEQLLGIYIVSVSVAYLIPITLFAWMVTSSGQTPGKKLCKIRIVTADTKQLPGFVKGVLIRSWAANVLYCIPFAGLIGYAMIFGDKRQCLHDVMAGTIVVDT